MKRTKRRQRWIVRRERRTKIRIEPGRREGPWKAVENRKGG